MAKIKTFHELFEQAQRKEEYWERWLVGDFIEALAFRMENLNISRSALAAKLGASPAYVTKVLRGETNLTVQSMAKLARALESVVRIHLAHIGTTTRFVDIVNGARGASSMSSSQMGTAEIGS